MATIIDRATEDRIIADFDVIEAAWLEHAKIHVRQYAANWQRLLIALGFHTITERPDAYFDTRTKYLNNLTMYIYCQYGYSDKAIYCEYYVHPFYKKGLYIVSIGTKTKDIPSAVVMNSVSGIKLHIKAIKKAFDE